MRKKKVPPTPLELQKLEKYRCIFRELNAGNKVVLAVLESEELDNPELLFENYYSAFKSKLNSGDLTIKLVQDIEDSELVFDLY